MSVIVGKILNADFSLCIVGEARRRVRTELLCRYKYNYVRNVATGNRLDVPSSNCTAYNSAVQRDDGNYFLKNDPCTGLLDAWHQQHSVDLLRY